MLPSPNASVATAVVEAYGAHLAVSAPDREALREIIDGLPRGWAECGPEIKYSEIKWRFGVRRDGSGFRVRDNHGREVPAPDLDLAIWMLRTQMRRFVGYHAQDLIFIHAGVVASRGSAIVLPGRSFAGKTTLVEALVRAGAELFSDEYAMIDSEGRVAHYREPLSVRGPRGQEEIDLGSGELQEPVPVGLVVLTVYKPGSKWSPQPLSIGRGIVAVMEHAVPARDRPADTLAALRMALADALILQSDRGEADETARLLLDLMSTAHA